MVPSWCVCTRSVRKAPGRKGRHLRLLCVLGEFFRCFVLELRHCLCSVSPPREPCVSGWPRVRCQRSKSDTRRLHPSFSASEELKLH